jgi:hypothetical protein
VLKSSEKAEAHIKQLEMQRATLERQVTAAEVYQRALELQISTAGRSVAHALMINSPGCRQCWRLLRRCHPRNVGPRRLRLPVWTHPRRGIAIDGS